MKKFVPFLLLLLLAACAPNGVQVPQSPILKLLERKSGLIAYIGIDGNIYLTDQAASFTTPLTNDVTAETKNRIAYRLPTWSQDGSHVAFIRLEQIDSDSLTAELFVANAEDESVTSVFSSETELPFYLNWSPDNENIGVLSTTAAQQTMLLQSIPVNGGERRILDTGTPFYWSWAPDGKTMIIHKNGATQGGVSQLSFLRIDSEVAEFVMKETPAAFQAPAWSPDGNFILLTTLSEDGAAQNLVLTDSTGKVEKSLAEIDLNTSFSWSPDSEQFAYIAGAEQIQNGAIGSLHIGGIDGGEEVVVEKDIAGFFWSPNGGEIAYLVPFGATPENSTQQVLYFELNVLDIASGESHTVATYQPTQEFLSLIPYIDQYQQSTTIWSPDGNNLVISFLTPSGSPAIAIVPASGVTEPRLLVEGSFASWSWK